MQKSFISHLKTQVLYNLVASYCSTFRHFFCQRLSCLWKSIQRKRGSMSFAFCLISTNAYCECPFKEDVQNLCLVCLYISIYRVEPFPSTTFHVHSKFHQPRGWVLLVVLEFQSNEAALYNGSKRRKERKKFPTHIANLFTLFEDVNIFLRKFSHVIVCVLCTSCVPCKSLQKQIFTYISNVLSYRTSNMFESKHFFKWDKINFLIYFANILFMVQ